jgi:hypothetical protein
MKNILLKIFLFVLLILFQENCHSQFSRLDEDKIITRFDEFKKTNTTLLKMKCYSVESRKSFWGKPDYTLNANFYKTPLSDSNITFSFSLIIRDIYEPLDNIAYLNINDSVYKFDIHNIKKNTSTSIDASTTGIGSEQRVNDISTKNLIIYNGKIYLPNYLSKQIMPTSKFVIRMYLDFETVTFNFHPSKTDLLYQFIQTK